MPYREDNFENHVLELLKSQNYEYVLGYDLHRENREILLDEDFIAYCSSQYKLNNNEIFRLISIIKNISHASLFKATKETLSILRQGVDFKKDNEETIHFNYFDFDKVSNNIFKVVNQFEVLGSELRRPDIVIFINGIPVSIIELKNPADTNTTIKDAFNDIYLKCNRGIPNLMRFALITMISDGSNTLHGTALSDYEYYFKWSSSDGDDYFNKGVELLETTIKGLFNQRNLLNIIQNYIYVPDETDKEIIIVPKYYQYFHAEKLYLNIKDAVVRGDRKGGTYFGATGSGKSFIMLFLTRRLTMDLELESPTILLITDRTDLDDQLSKTFVNSKQFLKDTNIKSFDSRDELKETLEGIKAGGIYLMTIQKFNEGVNSLSLRNNIIVISDEAHRSQTNLNMALTAINNDDFSEKAIQYKKTFGFAKYLRDSFPNATYVGFTGTPIDETLRVFGDVVVSYQMTRSQKDGSTVALEYIAGPDELKLDEQILADIDKQYNKWEKEGVSDYEIQESKRQSASVKSLINSPKRIKNIAKHFIALYEKRIEEAATVNGKAMFVCYDREVAFHLYQEIIALKPDWLVKKKHDENDNVKPEKLRHMLELPKIIMVATRDKYDSKELYNLLGTKEYRERLATEFKKPESNFKIAILVDMWITGFDVPCLDTIYIDKPLHRHSLIQTISRVNRIFKDKEKGVIVDYIGLKSSLAKALRQFGGDVPTIDTGEIALETFRNELSIVKEMFSEYGINKLIDEPFFSAANFILRTKDGENKFMHHTRILKSALDIAISTGQVEDEEVFLAHVFFAIRAYIYKISGGTTTDLEKMNRIVRKMVNEALDSEIDLTNLDANERIDLFSEEYLAKISKIKYPSTKLKALLYLLKKAIKDFSKVNRLKGLQFSEKLKALVTKYNNRDELVLTGQVFDDVIEDISREVEKTIIEVREEAESFKALGITFEEKAFYDILKATKDKYAFDYSDEKLKDLASKIKKVVDDKSKYTDWSVRTDIKNKLQVDIFKLLKRSGYPPVTNQEVYDQVFEQAENFKKGIDELS
ncbi:MAG: HsdR family type I site-specific deoxyribonuclease [Candidatus Izemoplasmatales bacterium]|jgi:type I restriction enzyme R subunit|nr:HsdR family type I site-specific deoxyribonuclease [Candidatus Izemoplasmatales bacterium]